MHWHVLVDMCSQPLAQEHRRYISHGGIRMITKTDCMCVSVIARGGTPDSDLPEIPARAEILLGLAQFLLQGGWLHEPDFGMAVCHTRPSTSASVDVVLPHLPRNNILC